MMQAPYRPFQTVVMWLLLFGATLIAACSNALETIEPGATITDYVVVDTFNKVDISRALNLTINVGEATDTVKLVVSEGFLPYMEVYVEDGTLILSVDDKVDISNMQSNFITITVPALERITASGASRVITTDTMEVATLNLSYSGASIGNLMVNAITLNLEASGASLFEFSGFADTFNAKPISGASIVQGFDLVTRICNVDASAATKHSPCFRP